MTRVIYDRFLTLTSSGETVPNGTIQVNNTTPNTNLTNLYDSRVGGSLVSNPFTADPAGRVTFYLDPGRYTMQAVAAGGNITYTDVIVTGEGIAEEITLDDSNLLITAEDVQAGFDETYVFLKNPTGVNSIEFENSVTPANTSSMNSFSGSGRQILRIQSTSSTGNGAYMLFYGANDSVAPNRALIGVDDIAKLTVDSSGVEIPDLNGVNKIRVQNPDASRDSIIEAIGGSTRRALTLYGRASQADSGWVRLFGSDDSVAPNQVSIGYGGVGSPSINVNASGVRIPDLNGVNSITLENSAEPANTSLIRAFSGAGRELLQIYSETGTSSGGYILLYGSGDSSAPDRVNIGAGGSNRLVVDSSGVTIPTLNGVNAITLENPDATLRTSKIVSGTGATSRSMGLFGRSTTSDGAWAIIYGDDDASRPNELRLGAGGFASISPALQINADNSTSLRDYGGNLRRAGWVPAKFSASSPFALTDAHIGNTLNIGTGTATVTIDSTIGVDGSHIELLNSSASASFTLAASGGQTLVWLQGGSRVSVSSLTVAHSSVITMRRNTSNTWFVWGNGIS